MKMDDVIEIKKADPDSQYRLLPCKKCGGDNVAYVHYNGRGGAKWRVECFDCVAPKRHPGCHAHCPEYIAERAKYDFEKAIRDQKKYISDGLTQQAINGVYKAKNAQKHQKGRC